MVRIWGLIKGYTPVKINLPESGRVKINIGTQLLKPAGKTIVGTLHLNGQTVYLAQGTSITIGSSPKCDIRIKDPAVQPIHVMVSSLGKITAQGSDVILQHVFSDGKTGILTAGREIKIISERDPEIPLNNSDVVVLPLSGFQKLLPIGFKLRSTFPENIQTSLAAGLKPSFQIASIAPDSLEKALAKVALVKAHEAEGQREIAAQKRDPLGLSGTRFKGAKNMRELFAKFFSLFGRAEILDIILPAAYGFNPNGPYKIHHAREIRLRDEFNGILKKLDPDICAASLLEFTPRQRAAFISFANRYESGSIIKQIAKLLPQDGQ